MRSDIARFLMRFLVPDCDFLCDWLLRFPSVIAPAISGLLRLHMMPDKGLQGMGAVCLDGSDAGFYFAPASDPEHRDLAHFGRACRLLSCFGGL